MKLVFNHKSDIAHLNETLEHTKEIIKILNGTDQSHVTLSTLNDFVKSKRYKQGHVFSEPSKDGRHPAGGGSINIGLFNICYRADGTMKSIRHALNQDTNGLCKDFFAIRKKAYGINGESDSVLRRELYLQWYKEIKPQLQAAGLI